jgi:multiple sugar transport system permease protein
MNMRQWPQQRLGWFLCSPAMAAMLLVTAYPIAYAVYLSLFRYDLRFPERNEFVGLANYGVVLSSGVWWQALANTLIITISSVVVELALGMGLALLMHRAIFGRRLLRTSTLIPYGIITVIAALAWKFAFEPTTGFVNNVFSIDQAWFTTRWSAFFVIIFTEIWKTTPFMSLLLLAGLTMVPEDLLKAARVDGANAWQRFYLITLPLMKQTIGVALLFRSLDAFRIFDTVFVQTRGAQNTESVSIVGYHALIARLNLGLGSTVSVLIFLCVLFIAVLYLRGFHMTTVLSRRGYR